MLHRFYLTLVAVLALLFGMSSASQAQVCTAGNCAIVPLTASVKINGTLACSMVQAIDFGQTRLASEGMISTKTAGATAGKITCTAAAGDKVDVSFSANPTMTSPAGGSIPITYGPTSLKVGTGSFGVDPVLGKTGYLVTASPFDVQLGYFGTGVTGDEITANLTGKPAGLYTGTITATITLQ